MVDVAELDETIADVMVKHGWQKSVEVSTSGMTTVEVSSLVDAIATASRAKGLRLKGIIVDAGLLAMPADAPFENAFYRNSQLIIADVNLNDTIIVRRV